MLIQTRVYKYNPSRTEVHDKMDRLGNHSYLKGQWINENKFYLRKNSFTFFKLEGSIDELESNSKLKIAITSDNKFLFLFILPIVSIIYGIIQWSENSEKGLILVLGGISLFIFIALIASSIIDTLKKSFKEAFHIM